MTQSCSNSSVHVGLYRISKNDIRSDLAYDLDIVRKDFEFLKRILSSAIHFRNDIMTSQISDLISSVIIYLCGFVLFIKITMNNMLAKKEEKKAQKLKAAETAGKEADQ